MPAILSRLARLYRFVNNAQPHPLHGKFADSQPADGAEWRSVIGANTFRNAVLLHRGITDPSHCLVAQAVDRLTTEHKPVECIGNSERVTALTIAAFKTAFEIQAPNLVRPCSFNHRLHMRHCTALPRNPNQTGCCNAPMNGTRGRPTLVRFDPQLSQCELPPVFRTYRYRRIPSMRQKRGLRILFRSPEISFDYQGFVVTGSILRPKAQRIHCPRWNRRTGRWS